MTLHSLMETLKADLQRHVQPGMSRIDHVRDLLWSQGVWATVVYRLGQWVYSLPASPASLPLKAAYQVAQKGIEIATGIYLPASTRIGPGLYIGHFSAIFIHPDAVIGRNFSVGQCVTMGTRGGGDPRVPTVGDDVYVGVGAKVLGGVTLGDGVHVGANAVVVHDVPPGHVAVGVPAVARPRRNKKAEE